MTANGPSMWVWLFYDCRAKQFTSIDECLSGFGTRHLSWKLAHMACGFRFLDLYLGRSIIKSTAMYLRRSKVVSLTMQSLNERLGTAASRFTAAGITSRILRSGDEAPRREAAVYGFQIAILSTNRRLDIEASDYLYGTHLFIRIRSNTSRLEQSLANFGHDDSHKGPHLTVQPNGYIGRFHVARMGWFILSRAHHRPPWSSAVSSFAMESRYPPRKLSSRVPCTPRSPQYFRTLGSTGPTTLFGPLEAGCGSRVRLNHWKRPPTLRR